MRTDTPPTPAFEEIDRDECLTLLASLSVGRVAVTVEGDAPLVVPVNYRVDGDVVVFRTGRGTKLIATGTGPISFQVDLIDPLHHTGWSVLVRGRAYVATHWEVEHLELEPWAGADKPHWVRLVPHAITGRRIQLPQVDLDPRGYL
jgi:nitroimidazol reductase NimA-like FMN-containing flavoprotein (pyridoxamine 5'-phosphate oxidase superfamily)